MARRKRLGAVWGTSGMINETREGTDAVIRVDDPAKHTQ
jgi:hypothetical protein